MRWQRGDDGLIVGELLDHRFTFLRGEMASLQRLAHRRLDEMPVLMPLGATVDLVISGALPQDERCRVLLDGFMPDEPDWVRQWWEPEFWSHLDTCAQLVADHVLINDRAEIADDRLTDAFTTALHAVALIAEQKLGADDTYSWVANWLRHVADTLISL